MSRKEVTERNFDVAVLLTSRVKPVIVEFWAPWASACRVSGPILDRLAREEESVWFVRVNVDDCPRLATRWWIHSIPTTVLFMRGKDIAQVVGAPPEEVFKERLLAVAV